MRPALSACTAVVGARALLARTLLAGSALAAVVLAAPPATGAGEATAAARAGSGGAPVVVAAGDIACAPGHRVTANACHQARTAQLVAGLGAAVVLPLGDEVYPSGAATGFRSSYGPTWGQFKAKSRPVPGNHEYETPGAAGYFGYFGRLATPQQPGCTSACEGYYSYRLGSWLLVALNPRCAETSGTCAIGADQLSWLNRQLANSTARCTLAYMHEPRFANGFGATAGVAPLWNVLYEHHVDVVLAGHAHNYQRFRAQDPGGRATAAGITEYIVGTGGVNLLRTDPGGNQVANAQAFGVARFVLGTSGWTQRFVDEQGAVLDSSNGSCH